MRGSSFPLGWPSGKVASSWEGGASGVWLAQDALFVADLVAFQARLVARAPRSAQGLLAQGVVGLVAELWVMERIYLEAWRYAGTFGAAGPYAAAVAHWTGPVFATYVAGLQELAESA